MVLIYDILKIGRKKLTDLMNGEGVCRSAMATPGLLIMNFNEGCIKRCMCRMKWEMSVDIQGDVCEM